MIIQHNKTCLVAMPSNHEIENGISREIFSLGYGWIPGEFYHSDTQTWELCFISKYFSLDDLILTVAQTAERLEYHNYQPISGVSELNVEIRKKI